MFHAFVDVWQVSGIQCTTTSLFTNTSMPMQYVVHANLKAPHHHGPGAAGILHRKY
jgi:hypothetical protein